MKQKWLELTLPQRVMLLLQGFLILLFLILYCTVGRQQVVWYDGAPLRYRADGETAAYSGKVDGQRAVFTVSPGPVVEYRLGDVLYGPYTIVHDPSAVPDEKDTPFSTRTLVGVELREGGQVLFRGSYLAASSPNTIFMLFDENGNPYLPISGSSGSARLQLVETVPGSGAYGTIPDHTPGISTILQLALAPEAVRRGQLWGLFLGVFCCLACALSILFADALFRWNLHFLIRDPERAEPSDWELFGRWIGWVVFTIMALVIFIIGLTVG